MGAAVRSLPWGLPATTTHHPPRGLGRPGRPGVGAKMAEAQGWGGAGDACPTWSWERSHRGSVRLRIKRNVYCSGSSAAGGAGGGVPPLRIHPQSWALCSGPLCPGDPSRHLGESLSAHLPGSPWATPGGRRVLRTEGPPPRPARGPGAPNPFGLWLVTRQECAATPTHGSEPSTFLPSEATARPAPPAPAPWSHPEAPHPPGQDPGVPGLQAKPSRGEGCWPQPSRPVPAPSLRAALACGDLGTLPSPARHLCPLWGPGDPVPALGQGL